MTSITILLQAGRLPQVLLAAVHMLAEKHKLGVYLTTLQNLRLTNVPEAAEEEVKAVLSAVGAEFKAPGKFPIPRVCVGLGHCAAGLIDTESFSGKILSHFAARSHTKGKIKIALAGCPMCCSGVKTSDIGIMATRSGYEVFVGGKGGANPRVGRRIARQITEAEVMDILACLIEFHDRKTEKKQRLHKLLDDPEFPFPEI